MYSIFLHEFCCDSRCDDDCCGTVLKGCFTEFLCLCRSDSQSEYPGIEISFVIDLQSSEIGVAQMKERALLRQRCW